MSEHLTDATTEPTNADTDIGTTDDSVPHASDRDASHANAVDGQDGTGPTGDLTTHGEPGGSATADGAWPGDFDRAGPARRGDYAPPGLIGADDEARPGDLGRTEAAGWGDFEDHGDLVGPTAAEGAQPGDFDLTGPARQGDYDPAGLIGADEARSGDFDQTEPAGQGGFEDRGDPVGPIAADEAQPGDAARTEPAQQSDFDPTEPALPSDAVGSSDRPDESAPHHNETPRPGGPISE